METLLIILQLVTALGIYNVWLVRPHMATAYRGGGAQSMKEEFRAYGLPVWFMYVAGGIKLLAATALIAGIWIPMLVQPAAIVLAVMMAGAVSMHIKIHDSVKQAAPSVVMLALAVVIALLG